MIYHGILKFPIVSCRIGCNFRDPVYVVVEMTLWGRTICLFVCLIAGISAEPSIDPMPVCEVTAGWKNYDGKAVALLGRYSFRESGPQKGRWLDQEACDGKTARAMVRLTFDSKNAPKPPDQVAIDELALEKKLALIRQHTALGKFRFGSADYDRWAVVLGKFQRDGGEELELVYRGDGAVFFLADK